MKSIVLFISLCVQITHAYNNGAPGSRLPVLGWSSWVALGPGSNHPIFDYCDEESVKQSADAFVSLLGSKTQDIQDFTWMIVGRM